VRSDGASGYLFVSHYQYLSTQPDQKNVQFQIKLAGGAVTVPSAPVTIPYNSRFFWPLNLDLGGVRLISASAQPIAQVMGGNTRYSVFKQTPGIPAEFVFDATTATLDSATGNGTGAVNLFRVSDVPPGPGAALRLHGQDGSNHVIIVLDSPTSLNLWKGTWQGQDRLFLTRANLLLDGDTLRLRAESLADCSVGILPAPAGLRYADQAVPATDEGEFRRFSPQFAPVVPPRVKVMPEPPLQAKVEPIQPAGPARTIPLAPSIPARRQGMAMQPEDADFASAAVWRVGLPTGVDAGRDLRLRVRYTGDVARCYHDDELIDDDFYHARPFEIGLRRHGPTVYQDGLVLKILPLRQDAPIYLTDRSQLKFNDSLTALTLDGVEVVETHEVRMVAAT
jgi:hypothetical protein